MATLPSATTPATRRSWTLGLPPSYFRYNFLKQNPWELELDVGLVGTAPRGPLTTSDPDGKPLVGEKWTFEVRHDLRFQDDPCFPGGKG